MNQLTFVDCVKKVNNAFGPDWKRHEKADLEYSTNELHQRLSAFLKENPLSSILDLDEDDI